jgi:hypothetical protein
MRAVTEAYDAGKLPLDIYVAAVGMDWANVRPETPEQFAAGIEESLASVPSRTVVAMDAFWRSRIRPPERPSFDTLFEDARRRLDSTE